MKIVLTILVLFIILVILSCNDVVKHKNNLNSTVNVVKNSYFKKSENK